MVCDVTGQGTVASKGLGQREKPKYPVFCPAGDTDDYWNSTCKICLR